MNSVTRTVCDHPPYASVPSATLTSLRNACCRASNCARRSGSSSVISAAHTPAASMVSVPS